MSVFLGRQRKNVLSTKCFDTSSRGEVRTSHLPNTFEWLLATVTSWAGIFSGQPRSQRPPMSGRLAAQIAEDHRRNGREENYRHYGSGGCPSRPKLKLCSMCFCVAGVSALPFSEESCRCSNVTPCLKRSTRAETWPGLSLYKSAWRGLGCLPVVTEVFHSSHMSKRLCRGVRTGPLGVLCRQAQPPGLNKGVIHRQQRSRSARG